MDEMSRKRYTNKQKKTKQNINKNHTENTNQCVNNKDKGGNGMVEQAIKKLPEMQQQENEDCEWEVQLWAVWIWDL